MTTIGFTAILVLGLATYRISRIIPIDDIAEPVRERIALWAYPTNIEDASEWKQWAARLVSCMMCLSVHVAWIMCLFYSLVVAREWLGWEFPIAWFAVAGISGVATMAVER